MGNGPELWEEKPLFIFDLASVTEKSDFLHTSVYMYLFQSQIQSTKERKSLYHQNKLYTSCIPRNIHCSRCKNLFIHNTRGCVISNDTISKHVLGFSFRGSVSDLHIDRYIQYMYLCERGRGDHSKSQRSGHVSRLSTAQTKQLEEPCNAQHLDRFVWCMVHYIIHDFRLTDGCFEVAWAYHWTKKEKCSHLQEHIRRGFNVLSYRLLETFILIPLSPIRTHY